MIESPCLKYEIASREGFFKDFLLLNFAFKSLRSAAQLNA